MANCLLAGFEGDSPRLYWLDYLGSVVEVRKAAHGYAEYLVSSTMDTLETKVKNNFKLGCFFRGRIKDNWSMPKINGGEIRDEPKIIHNKSDNKRRDPSSEISPETWRLLIENTSTVF